MSKSNNSLNASFSYILEETIINRFDQNFNKSMLQRFLTKEEITTLTIELLENNEWEIFETAVMGIFTEKKDQELLPNFFYSIGNFIDMDENDYDCGKTRVLS